MSPRPVYDMLIRNGTVVDQALKLHDRRDIAIANGKVAALEMDVPEEHADVVIVGIKIRMGRQMVGDDGAEALKRAREVSEATGLPLMIHPNASPVSLKDQLRELRSGDIVTHCFHKSDTGILTPDGKVRREAVQAIEDGILFDVGHGAGSFSFDVAETAMAQGVVPGTISSDLHNSPTQGAPHASETGN